MTMLVSGEFATICTVRIILSNYQAVRMCAYVFFIIIVLLFVVITYRNMYSFYGLLR